LRQRNGRSDFGCCEAFAEVGFPAVWKGSYLKSAAERGNVFLVESFRDVETSDFRNRNGVGIQGYALDFVAGTDFPFARDGTIEAVTATDEELLDHVVRAEADAEFVARQARLGHNKFGGANCEPVAEVYRVLLQALGREVLSKYGDWKIAPGQFFFPKGVVLDGVTVDGLVLAAVDGEICLAVAVQVKRTNGYAAFDGIFVDASRYRVAVPEDVARQTDVYRDQSHLAGPFRGAACMPRGIGCRSQGMDSAELPGFRDKKVEFVERAWPVFAKEAGEGAVGEEFAGGLAGGAIVRFVAGVADALDFGPAARAGLFVAAVDGHALAEGGDFFGEFAGGLRAQAIGPVGEVGADGFEEAHDFGGAEFLGKRERRELGFPDDFVGVGVADTAEKVRVGERPLESVVGGEKCRGELLRCGAEDFKAARIERAETAFAEDDVQRCAFLRAGFGPEQGTIGKVEGSKTARRGNFDAAGLCAERMPMKTSGDHEMEDQPEVVFETDTDAFAEAA